MVLEQNDENYGEYDEEHQDFSPKPERRANSRLRSPEWLAFRCSSRRAGPVAVHKTPPQPPRPQGPK
jgi:hypothetical protein